MKEADPPGGKATRLAPLRGSGDVRVAPDSTDDPRVTARTLPAASHGLEDFHGVVLRDHYQMVRKLGQGGMGEVWLGNHLTLGTKVAIKMIHPSLARLSEESRRFAHEAHALSLLNHPNVVRVLDVVRDREMMFIVMEFLEGESLGARIERAGEPQPLVEVVDVISQICEALEAVHGLGIVHRDLKPDNVFLTRDIRSRIRVKVVDFGLAHVDDPRDEQPLTNTGTLAGTPPYMSPEQCRSLRVGPSADLYSLGCILTEMLQLKPPFSAATSVDLIARHLFTPPPALTRPIKAEPVPPLLEKLRLDLLAKTPERRPGSAREVLDRLAEAMDPVRAATALPNRSNAHGEPRNLRVASLPPPSLERDEPTKGLVCIVRVGGSALLDDEITTAFQSRNYTCRWGLGSVPPNLVVLDAASVADAEGWFMEAAGRPTTIVCIKTSQVDSVSRLVAAGAAAVVRYPIEPDALLSKADSLMRRRARR